MALGELRLPGQQFGNLALDELLVENLPARDAVDLRAQGRDAVFIGLLHAGLPRGRGAEQIVAQHQIRSGKQIADRHRSHHRAHEGGEPRPYDEVPDFVAAGDDDGVRFSTSAEDRSLPILFHGHVPNSRRIVCRITHC